ncbi:hypothetical protein Atai01_29710 [Amycolatopsis taiwanensis]|uniref:DUF222 domain-containing protein n=2 Tax=Amycolatopsis taiwanensis TaxID=342230 RepID=A0A9W6VGC1_9PSEU|nr:hypothetical protein Atai01_29710 [Amycolatopsis taiwanensis]
MMYNLFSLCGDDIARMSDHAAVETMTVARETICRSQAIQVHAIARLCKIRGHTRWVADEVALELSVSRQAAAGLVDVAETLTTRLPRLLAAMEDGEVDLRTAGKICDVTAALSDDQAREVDKKIAGRLAGKDSEKVRRIARDAVCAIDPDGYAQRAKKRRKDRRVELLMSSEVGRVRR